MEHVEPTNRSRESNGLTQPVAVSDAVAIAPAIPCRGLRLGHDSPGPAGQIGGSWEDLGTTKWYRRRQWYHGNSFCP